MSPPRRGATTDAPPDVAAESPLDSPRAPDFDPLERVGNFLIPRSVLAQARQLRQEYFRKQFHVVPPTPTAPAPSTDAEPRRVPRMTELAATVKRQAFRVVRRTPNAP